jgi:RNA polymerase sigma-70 factor (ECF subfamily)
MKMIDNLSLPKIKEKSNESSSLKDFLPLDNNRKVKLRNIHKSLDEVLISKLKLGDYSAFSCIFSAYYKDLVLFASRYTHDYYDAEEIVQDIFVKLWDEHKLVSIERSLKSFLLKSVQNKCIDWCRHKKIKQTYCEYIMETSLLHVDDTENYILYSELHKEVEYAIKQLPDQISEVYCMNRYQGRKYKEIADILNVSVRTVEVRIGKALCLLRKHLKEYL